jgi:hypothetical protein
MRFSTALGLVALSVSLAVAADTPGAGDGAQAVQWPIDPLAIVLIGIFAFVAVMLWYVWGLRDRLRDAITNDEVDAATRASVLAGYSDWPLVAPRGTLRAVLALIIVFGSVAFVGLSIALPDRYKFPDVIVGIMGAVLGLEVAQRLIRLVRLLLRLLGLSLGITRLLTRILGIDTRFGDGSRCLAVGRAVFNDSPANRWQMLQYPIDTSEHRDRFVHWFDHCTQLFSGLQPAPQVSFMRLLRGDG